MHIDTQLSYLKDKIKSKPLTYLYCTTHWYNPDCIPLYSVRILCYKESNLNSYDYSCGHSCYHKYHPHILKKTVNNIKF